MVESTPRPRGLRHVARAAALMLAATAFAACVAEPNEVVGWQAMDRQSFACEVEPVLERECSMPACHGAPGRRFLVYAPGRMRIYGELIAARAAQTAEEGDAGHHPKLTAHEIDANFASARAMVLAVGDTSTPLLDKPLAVAAGGGYHAPDGDVFASRDAPGYQALLRWVNGEATCP